MVTTFRPTLPCRGISGALRGLTHSPAAVCDRYLHAGEMTSQNTISSELL